jgi:hypothetical protein
MMNRVRIQFWVCIALGVAVVCLLEADAAYSIPLGSGQSLWLFGDTFVGSPRQDRAHNEPACRGTRSVSLNVTISTARCGTSGTGCISHILGHSLI